VSISNTPPTPILAADDPRHAGTHVLEFWPGMRFISVAAIVLGSLWLIGGVGQIVAAFVRAQDPMRPIYTQLPLLGTWRWGSAGCAVVAGGLALLGGIDGVRRRPAARPLLRLATLIAFLDWLIDLVLWGGWCLDIYGVASSSRFYYVYAPLPNGGFGRSPFVLLRAQVAAALTVSTIVTLAWTILVLTLGRPRRAARAEHASGTPSPVLPVGPSVEPPGDVPPRLSYQSPGTRVGALPLQAGPVLLKALFWTGIVVGLLNVVSDVANALQYLPALTVSRPLGPPRAGPPMEEPEILAGLFLIGAAAALTVIIGCVLGLARRINAARVVLFIGLTVALLLALAQLQRQLTATAYALPASRWPMFLWSVAAFFRGQVYTVICFVALARAPTATVQAG
jgi:hypothetical protein